MKRTVPLLERMHDASAHVDADYADDERENDEAPDPVRQAWGQLVRLRRDLKSAIEKEDYEEAAALRDQIQVLEREVEAEEEES